MVLLIRLFAEIVRLIFMLISQILLLVDDLSKYNFFSMTTIKNFTNKVYIILGVLMLFKLVISAVQYLVNPDMLDDKNKGLGAILKKTIIATALLVLVPVIFDYAIYVQGIIVENIPKIVFGQNVISNTDLSEIGDTVSITVLDGLVHPKDGKSPSKVKINNVTEIPEVLLDGCGGFLDDFFGDKCVYDGYWLLSIPIGIFLVFILASMAIDVAIRTIKLGIVQILAPIPIANYITDDKKLSSWAKTSMQIYVDLFIRMVVIYFVIYFLKVIMKDILNINNVANDLGRTPGVLEFAFIKIFIIVALLLFAKNAPKFICDLIGLEGAGESMGDMFKRASGMFGTTVGTGRALYAARRNNRNEAAKKAGIDFNSDEWRNKSARERRQALKEAVKQHGKGGTARAFRSAGAALKDGLVQSVGHTKGFKETMSSGRTAAERSYDLDKALQDNGVTREQYRRELINRRLGIQSSLDVMNAEIDAAKMASDRSKAALDYVHSNMSIKFGGVKFTDDMMNDADFLKKLQVVQGVNEYSFGGGSLKIDLSKMSNSGGRTIAGIMNDLTKVIENKNGTFSGEDTATASRLLDKLQGEADKYVINQTKKIEEFKAKYSNPDDYKKAFEKSEYSNLGFDATTNPAFGRMIQEALEGNIIHSADTQFGREVYAKAIENEIIDKDTGKVKIERIGDWLNLNKSMGQNAQTSNIAAKGGEGAAATIKSIADKYDNKK